MFANNQQITGFFGSASPSLPEYPTKDEPTPIWEVVRCQDVGVRFNHSMTVVDDHFVIFGGTSDLHSGQDCCNTNIIFDPQTSR